MNWIIKFIKDLISRKYYGKITLSFEQGKIVNVKKSENIKPE
jgi:hypothetical protein